MAREMGSPSRVDNRRRRTRKGPEPACVQTHFDDKSDLSQEEEATVYVKELNLVVTEMLLVDAAAVLSLGKTLWRSRVLLHWTNGQKSHLIKNGRNIERNTANYVPFAVPGLSTSSSSTSSPTSPTSLTSSSQKAVTPTQHPASTRSESVSDEVRGDSSRGPAEAYSFP